MLDEPNSVPSGRVGGLGAEREVRLCGYNLMNELLRVAVGETDDQCETNISEKPWA